MGNHLERAVGSDWVWQGKVRVAHWTKYMNARVKHTEDCLCTANMCQLAYAIKRYYKECASAHISSLSAARLWPYGVKRNLPRQAATSETQPCWVPGTHFSVDRGRPTRIQTPPPLDLAWGCITLPGWKVHEARGLSYHCSTLLQLSGGSLRFHLILKWDF